MPDSDRTPPVGVSNAAGLVRQSAGQAQPGNLLEAETGLQPDVIVEQQNRVETDQPSDVAEAEVERRRPGRRSHVSPHLIPLLRGQPVEPLDQDEGGELAPAFGVAMCVVLSVPIWVGIFALIWFVF